MDDELFDALVEDAVRITAGPKFSPEKVLFKEQLDFVRDKSKFATAVCSVRAGKTTADAADLISTCFERPGTTQIYTTQTRGMAKRIIWPELHAANQRYDLGGIPNESDLSFTFGDSIIYLFGANHRSEIDKQRGLSNVALAIVDEAQMMRAFIQELCDDVLIKRLYDTNGRLRLTGTPGPVPAGYFHDASKNDKWSHHGWTLHQNPWIEKKSGMSVQQLIQQDCDRRGVGLDDPSIQRECFGRWVLDTNSLLLEYIPERNNFDSLPVLPGGYSYSYILGMDFGFEDADAFSVLAWSDLSPATYLVEELIAEKQTYEMMAENFATLYKRYPTLAKVVADPGGGGKKLIESLKQRYQIPMEIADKQGKIANYGLLNNALRTSRFFAKRDSRFAQDCNLLEKDRDKSTPERTIVKGHSDAVDACLYAFRASPAYGYVPPVSKAMPGTAAYDKEQEEKHIQAIQEQIRKEQQMKQARGGYGSWSTDQRGLNPWQKW